MLLGISKVKKTWISFWQSFIILSLLLTANTAFAALDQIQRGVNIDAEYINVIKTPFIDGSYRALIIGNNTYNDPEGVWQPLNTAISDAEGLAETLSEQYAFGDILEFNEETFNQLFKEDSREKIWLVKNGSRENIIDSFDLLTRYTQKNDNVIIFYAGHGAFKSEKDLGFWVPVDARGSRESSLIYNASIQVIMKSLAMKAQHTLLLSDSCFSGALVRGGSELIPEKKHYEKLARKKSVQIFAAGGKEFVDDDYKGSGHSPFSYFVLQTLKNNKHQYYSFREMANDVTKLVAINAAQTPELGPLKNAGHEFGDFFFHLKQNPLVNTLTEISSSNHQKGGSSRGSAVDASQEVWALIKESQDIADLEDFIATFPTSPLLSAAKFKLRILKRNLAKDSPKSQTSSVIYWHQSGLTLEMARTMKAKFEAHGLSTEVIEHRDPDPPDAIFIGALVNVNDARLIINSLPYAIKYIFSMDYPQFEGGDPNGLLIGVGYMSTHNKGVYDVNTNAINISQNKLDYLIEDGISNVTFQRRLREITSDFSM